MHGQPCGRHRVPGRADAPAAACVAAAAEVITPDDVFDALEADVKAADAILWVGISFQQSASTAYFRRVRRYLQARPLLRPDVVACCMRCAKRSTSRMSGHVRRAWPAA